ncbi:MAG TPA: hypothetical protein DE061_00115 [Clostridiales bacterium]|nr:hypothetical protein [Clostridiales bacterium]
MKTKQEQIDKMASIIFETINRENIDRFVEDKDGNLVSVETVGIEGIAEALIENGYGDVSEYKNRFEVVDKVLTETRAKLTKAEHDRDRYKAYIDRLEYDLADTEFLNDRMLADVERLKTETKQAKIDVLNKLKARMIEDGIFVEICNWHINKLIEEIEK